MHYENPKIRISGKFLYFGGRQCVWPTGRQVYGMAISGFMPARSSATKQIKWQSTRFFGPVKGEGRMRIQGTQIWNYLSYCAPVWKCAYTKASCLADVSCTRLFPSSNQLHYSSLQKPSLFKTLAQMADVFPATKMFMPSSVGTKNSGIGSFLIWSQSGIPLLIYRVGYCKCWEANAARGTGNVEYCVKWCW